MKLLIGPRMTLITGNTIASLVVLYSRELLLDQAIHSRVIEIPTLADDGTIVSRKVGAGADFPWTTLALGYTGPNLDNPDTIALLRHRIKELEDAHRHTIQQLTTNAEAIAARYASTITNPEH
ncbi:hypothetical protein ACIRCZ_19615 [Leifsonia sp. NPDC102414]|uniref:hypothetical protein n=1 Tax=Leifsonia sp. NPDC102414 TaxID=3364124 RepID=UPI00380B8A2C